LGGTTRPRPGVVVVVVVVHKVVARRRYGLQDVQAHGGPVRRRDARARRQVVAAHLRVVLLALLALDGPPPRGDVEGERAAEEGERGGGYLGRRRARRELGGQEEDVQDGQGAAEVRLGLGALHDGEEGHGVPGYARAEAG